MKQYLLLFIVAALLLGGCGAAEKESADIQAMDSAKIMDSDITAREEALDTLNAILARKVKPELTDRADLQKSYPKWFDKEGNIMYPVTLESKEYQNAEGLEEQYDFFRLPVEIVKGISTEELLEAVEKNPFLYSQPYEIYEVGLAYLAASFGEIEELLGREDAGIAAAKMYLSRELATDSDQIAANELYRKVMLEEFIILRKASEESMTVEKRDEVEKAFKKNYAVEKELNRVSGNAEYLFEDVLDRKD